MGLRTLSGRSTRNTGIIVGKKKMLNRRGQNLAEVVIIFTIISLALVAMQPYVKRGIQGRVKDLTDSIIDSKQIASTSDSESGNSKTNTTNVTTVRTKTGGLVYKTVDETGTLTSYSETKNTSP